MQSAPAAVVAFSLFLFATGCATKAPLACSDAGAKPRIATVYYATDREQQGGAESRFGPKRTDPPGLHLGIERVSIGREHRLGKVDAAVAMAATNERTESADGPRTDALRRTDAEITAFVNTTLRRAIRATPRTTNGGTRPVLLFVHGYNTTYPEAVRKTAQLAGDLEFVTCSGDARGVAIAYSWPAQGKLLGYLADEENAEWTQQRLAPFIQALARVCRQEGAELHLMAHSMGARALIRSLADLANSGGQQAGTERLADHVVLLAPDIGKGLFDQYVERFLPLVGHLTIYVSARDRALSLSRLLHGGHQRVGLIESTLLAALELTGLRRDDHRELGYGTRAVAEGRVDMIDVTGSFATQFGHSYEDPSFIRDLREVIYRDTPAGTGARSVLQQRETGPGVFLNMGKRQLRYFRLEPNS
jgi:esterase/lipase superfamily enzyme